MLSLLRTSRSRVARVGTGAVAALATVITGLASALPAQAANVVTPGSFTGHGFDQCTAPSQQAMNAWRLRSPYFAAGIYISGDSRGCTSQPNLSARWVSKQLAGGWRLLPITLGPQASCTTRARYRHQVRISPRPAGSYARARQQGRAEARKTVRAAARLGITRGSTLWYDIEAFSISARHCRESALGFLSAWTNQLHRRHYVSGIYSSAASGLRMLDDARATRPGRYRMPDQVWIADWNGSATTSSRYVRSDGWTPHRRVHQYRGGHVERYGGVAINIDNNWVDLGRGSRIGREATHCGGAASYNFGAYATRDAGDRGRLVRTVQCLLTRKGYFHRRVSGFYSARLGAAVSRYRVAHGLPAGTATTQRTWVTLLSEGSVPVLKRGSAATSVRRVQRALNAADRAGLRVTGVFGSRTAGAVRRYQRAHGRVVSGVVTPAMWRQLQRGTL